MDNKAVRWFFVAFAAVLIALIAACTVAYVVDPHEFNCGLSGPSVTPGCGK